MCRSCGGMRDPRSRGRFARHRDVLIGGRGRARANGSAPEPGSVRGQERFERHGAARPAAELIAMVGRVFAERHGLAVERHREIGERHTGVEGDVERARFIVAERPNVAVDKAEAIRARGERSFGPSQACRQDLGRDTAIVRTKARLVGLGPVRTKPPAIAVGMKPAQARVSTTETSGSRRASTAR